MKNIEAMKAIRKAFNILNNIESIDDLKRHKLTVSDYHAAQNIFHELTTPGSCARTYFANVAAFYESCDFLVVLEKGYFLIWTEA